MSVPARGFSARVQLPCRVFCGPDSILELSGVAVSIDTGTLVLALPARDSSQSMPQPGDKVRLELSLPVTESTAGAKCLELRARVSNMTTEGRRGRITATVPMNEILRYTNVLKSITSGRGSFTMRFSSYEEAPPDIQQAVSAAYQGGAEEDED